MCTLPTSEHYNTGRSVYNVRDTPFFKKLYVNVFENIITQCFCKSLKNYIFLTIFYTLFTFKCIIQYTTTDGILFLIPYIPK